MVHLPLLLGLCCSHSARRAARTSAAAAPSSNFRCRCSARRASRASNVAAFSSDFRWRCSARRASRASPTPPLAPSDFRSRCSARRTSRASDSAACSPGFPLSLLRQRALRGPPQTQPLAPPDFRCDRSARRAAPSPPLSPLPPPPRPLPTRRSPQFALSPLREARCADLFRLSPIFARHRQGTIRDAVLPVVRAKRTSDFLRLHSRPGHSRATDPIASLLLERRETSETADKAEHEPLIRPPLRAANGKVATAPIFSQVSRHPDHCSRRPAASLSAPHERLARTPSRPVASLPLRADDRRCGRAAAGCGRRSDRARLRTRPRRCRQARQPPGSSPMSARCWRWASPARRRRASR